MRTLTVVTIALLLATPIHSQEVPLDKLNACSEMSAVVTLLTGSLSQGAQGCRAPAGDAEKRILLTFASISDGPSACVLEHPPAPMLRDFTCVLAAAIRRSASVDCFRWMPSAALDAYKSEYRASYATKAKAYLSETARCASSTGDASEVTNTTLTTQIASIAKFDFGFGSPLRLPQGEGMATHGFARMDPALAGPDRAAVEYFSAFASLVSPQTPAKASRTSGEWTVTTDPMTDWMKALNKSSYEPRNAYINGVAFEIESKGGPSLSDGDKVGRRRDWLEKIIWELEDEGFKFVSEKELRQLGLDTASFKRQLVESQPYGQQDLAARRADDQIYVLVDKKTPCVRRGGTRVSLLIGYAGTPGAVSEYGHVAAFVVGDRACARISGRGDIDRIVEHVSQAFPSEIRKGEQ